MTTKAAAAFFALAAKHDVEIEYSAGGRKHPRTGQVINYCIIIDAPSHHKFASTDLHSDCSMGGW